MEVEVAQREVRTVYRGGSVGQLVSGLIWLASAAAATYGSHRAGIVLLVVGGFFIFPATTLGLRLLGGPWKLSRGNPLGGLAMQVAFVVPLCLPLVAGAAAHRIEWFYPAFMIVVGAHYLPFVFLYGMRLFWVLGFLMVGLGLWLARHPLGAFDSFGGPGFVGGVVLLVFAALGLTVAGREERPEGA